jgi:Melibiase/Helicase HerA, central domain
MRAVLVHPRPGRRLVDLPSAAAVFECGAIGYLDAAEDDRRRWIAGFRALLDGLDAPLQVLVDFVPGTTAGAPAAVAPAALPPPDRRRAHDLAFARSLRDAREAQRREVRLVTTPAAAGGLERDLRAAGVPGVRRIDWQPPPGALFGTEHHSALHDRQGWHRTWWLDRFPGTELSPGWLLRLVPAGLRIGLAWHAERLPTAWMVEYLQRQLVHMRASQLHAAGGIGDPQVEGAAPATEALQQRLTASQENAFHLSLYLTVSAESPDALEAAAEQVEAAARSALCQLVACTFRQLDGRLATLPLGRDPLARRRVLDSSAMTTLYPWFDADLQDEAGIVVGRSRPTGQPVVVDPFDTKKHANANIGIFGHSGAGKTYLLSTLTMGALGLGAQVFVIDPEHEYGRLARSLGGLDVQLALGSGHAINVLDLRGTDRGEATIGPAVADTVDLCGVICGELDEAERAILEAGVRATFADVESPVLGDVAARLSPESRVARVLARWVGGSLGQLFSRPTSVDLEAPMVAFGMRELRAEMVAPVHYLLAEALWARIKRRDRRRLLVIDELGLLFEDPTVRRFVVALARRIRKYDGSLVFATQNPGDLLGGDAGAVVATNPALHFFGAQRPGEAAKLQRAFHLSEVQRAGLETAARGEFLLTAGASRLPVHVQAPPWQSTAMDRSRGPPIRRIGSRMGAPQARAQLTDGRLDAEWPARASWAGLVARCTLRDGTVFESEGWAPLPGPRRRFRAVCGPLAVEIELEPSDGRIRTLAEATALAEVDVAELMLSGRVEAGSGMPWVLYNGYQSWDPAGHLPADGGTRESWWTIGLADASGAGLVAGAASAEQSCTRFTVGDGVLRAVWCEAEGLESRPSLIRGPEGTRWRSDPLLVTTGDDVRRCLAAVAPGSALSMPAPVGWLSWYHFGPWVTGDQVLAHAALLAGEPYRDLGYRLVQVDDGWQETYGEWRPNTKFPGGLGALSEAITRRGQVPGLWLAPFLVGAAADVALHAPDDWFVVDPATGERAVDDRHRVFGPMYVLDASRPAVRNHLRDLFAALYDDGLRYFKIDFLYAGAYAGLAALRAGMEAIREGARDAHLVASGAPLLPMVGLVEGCRVGPDTATPLIDFETGVSTPTLLGDEVIAVGRNLGARSMLHSWFRLDADIALVGGNLTLEQGRVLVTLAALSGGPFLASDDLPALPADRLSLLTNPEVLELVGGTPALADWEPAAGDLPATHWRRGDVLAVFNWASGPAAVPVRAPGASGARDLWARCELKTFRDGAMLTIPAQGVRLLRVR